MAKPHHPPAVRWARCVQVGWVISWASAIRHTCRVKGNLFLTHLLSLTYQSFSFLLVQSSQVLKQREIIKNELHLLLSVFLCTSYVLELNSLNKLCNWGNDANSPTKSVLNTICMPLYLPYFTETLQHHHTWIIWIWSITITCSNSAALINRKNVHLFKIKLFLVPFSSFLAWSF